MLEVGTGEPSDCHCEVEAGTVRLSAKYMHKLLWLKLPFRHALS